MHMDILQESAPFTAWVRTAEVGCESRLSIKCRMIRGCSRVLLLH